MKRTLLSFVLRVATASGLGAMPAHASFLSGEALDKAADVVAIIVLVLVPILAIAVFWLVHVLPEKIAEKRQHPQKEAIHTLCLLSLVFGGLLWPIAWIWAYTKPVLYKLAYGREKHEDYYRELAENDAKDAVLLSDDISRLRQELDIIAARRPLPDELQEIRERLVSIEGHVIAPRRQEGAG